MDSATELIDHLNREGIRVILIGDVNEERDGETVFSRLGISELSSRCFGLPLNELMTLLKHARVYVGTDSGPLHLAAALNVAVVGLFGPAEPRFTAPVVPSASFIFRQVECSPCNQRACVRSNNPCMDLIGVEEVADRVKRLMLSERLS